MKRYVTVETQGKDPRKRCCARCRTPYNCGNQACTCHGMTLEQLIAAEAAK